MAKRKTTFIYDKLPRFIKAIPGISQSAKLVLNEIFQICQYSQYSNQRNKTIARNIGSCERTVARAVNALESKKLLGRMGLSINRKLFLGRMFKILHRQFNKENETKKNLYRWDRLSLGIGHNGILNNNSLTNKKINKKELSTEDLSLLRFYKDFPDVPIPEKHQYLFA